VKGMKSSEKFWRIVANLSLFYKVFHYFTSVLPNHYDVIVVDELPAENGMAGVLPVGFLVFDGGRE
jgi:hypothetical protein